jgi:hypothetical protein
MKRWIKEHKVIVIVIAVVILGLLVAIGSGTVDMPGQRGDAVETTS